MRPIAEIGLTRLLIAANDPYRNSRLQTMNEGSQLGIGQSLAQRYVFLDDALNRDFTRDTE
jgi:hypothetical protein